MSIKPELDLEEIEILISWYEILDDNCFEMNLKDQDLKVKLEGIKSYLSLKALK